MNEITADRPLQLRMADRTDEASPNNTENRNYESSYQAKIYNKFMNSTVAARF